jgi:hypothetical protein
VDAVAAAGADAVAVRDSLLHSSATICASDAERT